MRKQKDDMQVNVAGIRRNIKNLAHNYSDAQVKVREATSNDPWGPSATIMAEIADFTYNVVAFSEIMQMIWKRLNDHGKNWRHVYKALILLEYLIKTGTEKVAQQCKENIFAIQTLRDFVYFEEGKDQGTHVREKAKTLVTLLKDDERLKNERIKALKAKERFSQNASGFGSDGYIDGPVNRENQPADWQEEPPKPTSDLEFVRPQTAGEEELQLQLAMAMSREEAEQEEAKRRSDDVRLQLALSQSENDFKVKPEPKGSEPQQSHLLDLLDISLGAASISSPPLGAGAVGGSDPWGTPARAASQLSDPWSGTSSPQIDPWHPNVPKPSSSAAGGAEGWLTQRTQSPSAASGSSNEGWLQSNVLSNGTMNGNSSSSLSDPWLSKTLVAGTSASAPPLAPALPLVQNNISISSVDPWLPGDEAKSSENPLEPEDPWAPKALPTSTNNGDPWKRPGDEASIMPKVSPDLDDFDIITNRNKTGLIEAHNLALGSNNNNASLLDELDPLSSKKPSLKTPQSFLGENSALVNLDNLIKPVAPSNTIGSAAYNPFSDTIPPKTNLFQQQQPPVPSINQLKQQQPFAISLNQDPWAPVSNAAPQYDEYLIDYDSDQITICTSNNIYAGQFELNNNNDYLKNNDNDEPITTSTTNNKNNSSFFDNNDPFIVHSNNNTNNNFNHAPANNPYSYLSIFGTGYARNPTYMDSLAPSLNHHSEYNAYNGNGNLFSYGYYDTPNQSMNAGNMFASSAQLAGNFNNNNNNNLAWIKPEAAASNPFL